MTERGHKTFDVYADDYDVALARGISVLGEKKLKHDVCLGLADSTFSKRITCLSSKDFSVVPLDRTMLLTISLGRAISDPFL